MDKSAILTKAIEKAIAGGWQAPVDDPDDNVLPYCSDASQYADDVFNRYEPPALNSLIFNHDFARAVWGDISVKQYFYDVDHLGRESAMVMPAWKHHLQQMVVSNDPIAYLGEHL